MKKLQLPFVVLPQEFTTLLKSNISTTTSSAPIFDVIRPNPALYQVLENGFKEFDDGRGLEKLMMALGWANFRDRFASLYIFKSIYGDYPTKTNMELVEDIKILEQKFADHGVHSYSRIFLLGFFIKLANLQIQKQENNQFLEIKIPDDLIPIFKLSQGRSEKIDWLILIVMHFYYAFGEKMTMSSLIGGKKFEDLYSMMSAEVRETMHSNLLAYGASIREPEPFLYEKI